MIETIIFKERTLAIVLRTLFHEPGIHFFTPKDFSQQLAYMNRPKDYVIEPHVHKLVPRNVEATQEVLFIKSGKVRVDFYDEKRDYLVSRILSAGDVILLAHGGHGFTMLEESEIIEVKQGPYAGEEDKVRFQGVGDDQLKIQE